MEANSRLEQAYKIEKPRLLARVRAAGRSLEEAEDLVHDVYAETLARLLILCCILFKDFGSGHSSGRSDRKRRRQLRHYMREDHAAAGKTQEAQ